MPMIFSSTEDRLGPPDVPPVTREGVTYAQADDGRDMGHDQAGGVLVASDGATGKPLWTVAVYAVPFDPALEQDAQWVYFTELDFASDGRLRIVNEEGHVFFVDVTTREVTTA